MEGTLLNTDVSAYVNTAWSISALMLGGLSAWAILSWLNVRQHGDDK